MLALSPRLATSSIASRESSRESSSAPDLDSPRVAGSEVDRRIGARPRPEHAPRVSLGAFGSDRAYVRYGNVNVPIEAHAEYRDATELLLAAGTPLEERGRRYLAQLEDPGRAQVTLYPRAADGTWAEATHDHAFALPAGTGISRYVYTPPRRVDRSRLGRLRACLGIPGRRVRSTVRIAVRYDPREGLLTTSGELQPPILGLVHELIHVARFRADVPEGWSGIGRGASRYPNDEERKTTRYENALARTADYGTRDEYRGVARYRATAFADVRPADPKVEKIIDEGAGKLRDLTVRIRASAGPRSAAAAAVDFAAEARGHRDAYAGELARKLAAVGSA